MSNPSKGPAMKSAAKEQQAFEKYHKNLRHKIVQTIVQARLGERIRKPDRAKPRAPGSDWFGLYIQDLPEVNAEVSKTLECCHPGVGQNLCVEISLTTADGDTLILEYWVLGMKDQCDPTITVLNGVYNRMGQLLKVLICMCRGTPAYRLSCRQGPDSYVICYRVYNGDPNYDALGDVYQENDVGSVVTPYGTITMKVVYRTKFTIESHQAARNCAFVLKSDHFKPEVSPKYPRRRSIDQNMLDAGYPADRQQLVTNGGPPHHHHHLHPRPQSTTASSQPIDIRDRRSCFSDKDCIASGCRLRKSERSNLTFEEQRKIGAFVSEDILASRPPEFLIPEPPFVNLLEQRNNAANAAPPHKGKASSTNANQAANRNNATQAALDHNSNSSSSEAVLKKSEGSDGSTVDDFVMVELRPPFADCDSNEDLGAFFRECQSAPPLASFANQPSLAEQVNEISSLLAHYELNMPVLDAFVDSVCQTEATK